MRKITFIGQISDIEFAEAKKAPKSLKAKRAKANQFLLMKKYDKSGVITSRKMSRVYRERLNNSQSFGLLDKFKSKEQIASEIESGERNLGKKLWKKKAEEIAKKEADFVAEVKRKSEQVKREVAEKNLKLKQASKLKGKLGLGAIGLLTAGAIGYSVYRKIRTDKGKKRGNYKR